MKYFIFITFFSLCLLSCYQVAGPEKPEDLIEADKMANVIFEMIVINSAKGLDKKVLEENGIVPSTYVFNKYNIDSLQFAKSNDYYAYHVKEYRDIYADIDKKLEDLKKATNADAKELEALKEKIIAPPEAN